MLLKIDSLAISGVQEITNKEMIFKYTYLPEAELGIISGTIDSQEDFILELLDQRNNIIKKVVNESKYVFNNLDPQSYKLRVKIDLNKNGIWDRGDIKNKVIPEPIIFHNEEIKLRKNWEINDINFKYPTD